MRCMVCKAVGALKSHKSAVNISEEKKVLFPFERIILNSFEVFLGSVSSWTLSIDISRKNKSFGSLN